MNQKKGGGGERERERGGTEQKRDGPGKDVKTNILHVGQSTTLTWTHIDSQILVKSL